MTSVAKTAKDRSVGQSERTGRQIIAEIFRRASVLPILIPAWILFTALSPTFGTWNNVQTLLAATAVVAVAAVGGTLVLLTAGIDISVASVLACSAVLAGAAMGQEGSPMVGLLIALGVGTAFGAFNGFAVAVLGVTPFVLTLGTHLIARGIAFSVSEGIAMRVPQTLRLLGRIDLIGIPLIAFIAIAILIISGFLLANTTWGRYIYLLGTNKKAARYVGIRRTLIEGSVYVIAGFMSGLAGYLSIINLGVALPGVGDPILLTIIGGVILGGTSMFGGEGSMLKTALGVFLLATLSNGLNLIGFEFYDQLIVEGVVILLGTSMAVQLSRSSKQA
ncbi:MAG: ABC transporter permease [Anaerolineales bacterium]